MSCDVAGIGANSIDEVYFVAALPKADSPLAKLPVREHLTLCGGQTATAMAACASLGLSARYVGAVSVDPGGTRMKEELARRGVDVSYVVRRRARNPGAAILVDAAGDRIVLWERDASFDLTDDEVAVDALADARVLHVDDVDVRASIRAARIGRSLGRIVTTDIDRVVDGTDELIAAATSPVFAEHALAEITGERDAERGLRKLRARHDGVLCVTLGAKGSMALDGDALVFAPGFAAATADTTGAGDVFRAGLIYGVVKDWPMADVLAFANAAAAVSCTKAGAMNSAPMLSDVLDLLASTQTTFNMKGS